MNWLDDPVRTIRATTLIKGKASGVFRSRGWREYLCQMAAGDCGAELFEFALIAVLLLMLLLGIIWMGRAYNVYETITRAAREGARYAVLPSPAGQGNAYRDPQTASCASNTWTFNNYVAPALTASHLSPALVQNYCQKTQWLENTSPQQCGTVISFRYPVQLVMPFRTMTVNISTQAQMRLENQSSGGTCP